MPKACSSRMRTPIPAFTRKPTSKPAFGRARSSALRLCTMARVIGVLQILNPRDKESFDEQELDGFSAYANLTATAIEKLRALERMRAQERVERDLAIACDIQRELLARAIPVRIPGAVFAAHNQAASNVGGDFYNVFVRSPYEIYFAIGDVSGKGISASLLMAQTLSAMQFVFACDRQPVRSTHQAEFHPE